MSSLLEHSGGEENVGQGSSELRAVTFNSVTAGPPGAGVPVTVGAPGHSVLGQPLGGGRRAGQAASPLVHRKAFTVLTSRPGKSCPGPLPRHRRPAEWVFWGSSVMEEGVGRQHGDKRRERRGKEAGG